MFLLWNSILFLNEIADVFSIACAVRLQLLKTNGAIFWVPYFVIWELQAIL